MTARRLLVVIDPQKAFTHPQGTIARAYGVGEIEPGLRALAGLQGFLRPHEQGLEVGFVRSEYAPGQFTEGRLDHPLTSLCVPAVHVDCDWADGIDIRDARWVVTKHQADAIDTPQFRERLERAAELRAGGVEVIEEAAALA